MRRIPVFILFLVFAAGLSAQSELIISEYVEGWSNNKALEIYNPNDYAVALDEFRIVRYSNGEDTPPADDQWTVNLPSYSLPPYRTYVLVIDKRNPDGTGNEAPVWEQLQQRADAFLCPDYNVSYSLYFNGNDAVSIEKDEGGGDYVLIDLFARWGGPAPAAAASVDGGDPVEAWSDTAPYFTGEGLAITANHTMIRKSDISQGVTSNPTVFNPLAEYDTLPANTFDHLGWHEFDGAPANETPELTNEKFIWAVSPTATNGTEVVTVTATDAEEDALSFYIDAGNFIYIDDERYEPFELDKTTGVLSLVDEAGLAPAVKDTFYITLTVTDGYSQTDPVNCLVIVTDDEVGIDTYVSSPLEAYPNPVTDDYLQIRSDKGMAGIRLTNMLGQLVFHEEYSSPVVERNLNLDNKLNGVYLLNVMYNDRSTETRKLFIR